MGMSINDSVLLEKNNDYVMAYLVIISVQEPIQETEINVIWSKTASWFVLNHCADTCLQ